MCPKGKHRPSLVLTACFAVVSTGCLTSPNIEVAPAPLLQSLPLPNDAASSSGTVQLAGAINEVVSFTFTVRGDRTVEGPISLDVSDFVSPEGSISRSAIEIFRIHAVRVGPVPAWHIAEIPARERATAVWDALVPVDAPRGGLPAFLSQGDEYHFWVDVRIPKGAAAAEYTGRIRLLGGRKPVNDGNIELTVWPIVLPDDAGFECIADLDHKPFIAAGETDPRGLSPSETDVVGKGPLMAALRLLARHRVTAVLPQLSPDVGIDTSGRLEVDWSRFDALILDWIRGETNPNRQPLRYWPVPVHKSLWTRSGLDPSRDALRSRYLGEVSRRLRETLPKTTVYFRPRAKAVEPSQTAATTQLVSALAEGTNRVVPYGPRDRRSANDPDHIEGMDPSFVDTWAPPAQFIDPNSVASECDLGRTTWLVVDRPPYSGTLDVSAPPTYRRVLPWQAARLNVPVLHVGLANDWPADSPSATADECAACSSSCLVYPGGRFGLSAPIASVRLKQLRRGMQDAAYLRLLRDHGRDAFAERLLASIAARVGTEAYDAHFAMGRSLGWPRNWEAFESARQVMVDEMLQVVHGDAGGATTFANTATWRRFAQSTENVSVESLGVRMHVVGSPSDPRVHLESHLTVEHSIPATLGGAVSLTGWPDGWGVTPPLESFRALEPATRHRVTLEAETTVSAVQQSGAVDLSANVELEDGRSESTPVSVRTLTAIRSSESPEIDGDLSDWPLGTTNVASQFMTIATAPGVEAASRSAPNATTAFVLRDDANIYIAINSYTGARERADSVARTTVHYEDMIPIGEELVEVLIEPTNVTTRTPESLYHIVVKRSGTVLTERGIDLDPPVGSRAPWAADAEVAVAESADRWTAELRIPLSSFAAGPARSVFWGFNVTRFDEAKWDYSSWSGATGTVYDPISMGNLYLPP